MFRLSYDNVDGFLRGIWKGSVAGDAYASIPSELLRKNPCDRSLGRISIVNFHREISASEYLHADSMDIFRKYNEFLFDQ